MTEIIVLPLIGGIAIGIAAAALLALNGRIAGISGIFGGLVDAATARRSDAPLAWKATFIAGLVAGGALLLTVYPEAFPNEIESSNLAIVAAGLLVGFGTRLGSGCTSGHGVCGISRFSARSIVATITFIATGVITVAAVNALA